MLLQLVFAFGDLDDRVGGRADIGFWPVLQSLLARKLADKRALSFAPAIVSGTPAAGLAIVVRIMVRAFQALYLTARSVVADPSPVSCIRSVVLPLTL